MEFLTEFGTLQLPIVLPLLVPPAPRGKDTSTRRFFLRPSSVALLAIGYCSPQPRISYETPSGLA